tara:strand:+ start:108 stop:284 length:177 start_codon:yes stop_codon:yes gene_type:complete
MGFIENAFKAAFKEKAAEEKKKEAIYKKEALRRASEIRKQDIKDAKLNDVNDWMNEYE